MNDVRIHPQPDDVTCGPACLHSVYAYYGDDISIEKTIAEVKMLPGGGTLDVLLGCHALKRNYSAIIYTYNLTLFDPSWFHRDGKPVKNLVEKLRKQARFKRNKKLRQATEGYTHFLRLGGQILWRELTPELIRGYLNKRMPLITGLSSTYLYQDKRDFMRGKDSYYDDVRGEPSGHFVVLSDYTLTRRKIIVADPYKKNPISHDNYYKVHMQRLLNAILLGVVTYDANILVLHPKPKEPEKK
ncbi:MAG: hypothetical protein A3F54_01010 [Candidatus Kerfeldbacteria bacterium RIFCSPHIGHO2_12_FULL_48_17]|uniref:Peptidase C39-like domain-containing protein n=1 Tax=Candidatus Kerfeldbacteria bacterium RIFCSPHIGHO2_12_FULL_48_17 TaxID=1798542 RepID=A0A1G2AXS0_9BACT|nr:MAG: hypothetical protein A3F54_01010 [Candidatus Kerfeldbacteria bacterium RIFCSPHIGHO2_12_FULL_48_17]